MPLSKIDYANTIIYKIVCKNLDVKCCYTGHTTNLTMRKNLHKSDCNNENSPRYILKVYKTIRDNGGWDNFSMLQIEEFPCKNTHEASARERYHYEIINSNMNSNVPNRNSQDWYIDNREERLLWQKNYNESNREVILLYKKKQYEDNREEKLLQMKEYRKENAERIKDKKNETCVCACGKIVKLGLMHAHIKSQKHITILKSTQDEYQYYFKQWIQFYTDSESIDKQMKNQEYIDRFAEYWKQNWLPL
jgi:hypothetical protein